MIYILEFSRPLGNPDNPRGQARYYIGFCENGKLQERLKKHRSGNGAAITRAVIERGGDFNVVAVFKGGRDIERRLKSWKNTPRIVRKIRAGKTPAFLIPYQEETMVLAATPTIEKARSSGNGSAQQCTCDHGLVWHQHWDGERAYPCSHCDAGREMAAAQEAALWHDELYLPAERRGYDFPKTPSMGTTMTIGPAATVLDCDVCNGYGSVLYRTPGEFEDEVVDCEACGGTGINTYYRRIRARAEAFIGTGL